MKRAQPGWFVLVLTGIGAGIGSALPFYTFGGDLELTVWHRTLFPTATLIPLLVGFIGLEALFVLLMGREPRSPFLNFTWSQARLAGSAFAIVLTLCYLVQGRAGGSIGRGYVVLLLSALAAFGGAVLTRRAELTRPREEIVEVEHPWRAALLRWRRDLAAKAQAYANGAGPAGQRVQPVSESSEAATAEKVEKDAPAEKPAAPSPGPRPVPRLSAVQSEPAAEEKTEAKPDDQAAEKPVPAKPAPAKRKPAKAAAKKTGPQRIETAQEDAAPAKDEAPAEAKSEAKPEATPDGEPTIELETTTELEAKAEAEAKAETDAEVEPEPAEERERPAAPGG